MNAETNASMICIALAKSLEEPWQMIIVRTAWIRSRPRKAREPTKAIRAASDCLIWVTSCHTVGELVVTPRWTRDSSIIARVRKFPAVSIIEFTRARLAQILGVRRIVMARKMEKLIEITVVPMLENVTRVAKAES